MPKVFDSMTSKWIEVSPKEGSLEALEEDVYKEFKEEIDDDALFDKSKPLIKECAYQCYLQEFTEGEACFTEYEAFCLNNDLDQNNILINLPKFNNDLGFRFKEKCAKKRESARKEDVENRIEKKIGVNLRKVKDVVTKQQEVLSNVKMNVLEVKTNVLGIQKENELLKTEFGLMKKQLRRSLSLIETTSKKLETTNKKQELLETQMKTLQKENEVLRSQLTNTSGTQMLCATPAPAAKNMPPPALKCVTINRKRKRNISQSNPKSKTAKKKARRSSGIINIPPKF